ncbi:3321_t:CDS:2 [Gigaspora rosea]|nr:3321_t:CDS:2 [Gigaspora rosea]
MAAKIEWKHPQKHQMKKPDVQKTIWLMMYLLILPESLFLFRRSRSPSPTFHLLSNEGIIKRQIASIWNHITSSVASDELFQQFEQIIVVTIVHSRKKEF